MPHGESFSSGPSPLSSHSRSHVNEDSNWPIVIRKDTFSTRNPHPIYNFLCYHRLSTSYCSFISFVSSNTIPKNVKEAFDLLGWRQVMIDEMQALKHNDT